MIVYKVQLKHLPNMFLFLPRLLEIGGFLILVFRDFFENIRFEYLTKIIDFNLYRYFMTFIFS